MSSEIDYSKKKALTLDDLIAKKAELAEKKQQQKTKQLYIESLDSLITIKAPSRYIVIDANEKDEADAQVHLIYNSVVEPNLKSPELHKAFDCEGHPVKIVEKIFADGEIPTLAMQCITFAHEGNSVVDLSIKN